MTKRRTDERTSSQVSDSDRYGFKMHETLSLSLSIRITSISSKITPVACTLLLLLHWGSRWTKCQEIPVGQLKHAQCPHDMCGVYNSVKKLVVAGPPTSLLLFSILSYPGILSKHVTSRRDVSWLLSSDSLSRCNPPYGCSSSAVVFHISRFLLCHDTGKTLNVQQLFAQLSGNNMGEARC